MVADRQAVLVSADPLVLRGLRECVHVVPNLIIAAEATSAPAALAALAAHRPDLLLFHPGRLANAGLDLSLAVAKHYADVKVGCG
jgi:DNA-binding NarL/FixJ family response regulator